MPMVTGGDDFMKCRKCDNTLVKSNIYYECENDFYERYFCFGCETLYECYSDSGDYIEEYLTELGEIEYK